MSSILELSKEELEKIDKTIKQIASKYANVIEYDDSYQEGYLLLLEILNKKLYDKEKSQIHTYLATSLRNRLFFLSKNKNNFLDTISNFTDFPDNNEKNNIFEEIEFILAKLSNTDQELFKLLLQGMTLNQIAVLHNKSHEWARLKTIDLFKKIRSLYDNA